MTVYTLKFPEINKAKLALVGGKGANLGELSSISGVQVPDGFCITTEAFKEVVESSKGFEPLLAQFSVLNTNDTKRISETGAIIRNLIEHIPIPKILDDEISGHLTRLGNDTAYAVRSSATAEDLPNASFAGQQDTYLNIIGKEAVMKHIGKCWASLFTDRAIIYRMQNGFDHRKIRLSVVIQKMVFPHAAGVVFTADPITGNRNVLSIDASFGLGEALVSGIVNADSYKVRSGTIVDRKISTKKKAIYPLKNGGTTEQEIDAASQNTPALTNDQILKLERIGRKIEKHFGAAQDIEWCLVDNTFYIVQSRPITTLFPIPEANDQDNHVYISVGHQQMMTDPMKPLGLSLWQLTSFAPMHKAGGRLFVDITKQLHSPHGRNGFLNAMGQHDPLIKDALYTIIERGDFITTSSEETKEHDSELTNKTSHSQTQIESDPSIVSNLIKRNEKSLAALKENIQSKCGTDLLDFIQEDIQRYFRKSLFDPQSMGVIMTAIDASLWINEKMNEWLGEKNVADMLSRSAAGNITSEMGLELLDVADVIRSSPEVVQFLQNTHEDNFLDELPRFEGGKEARSAIINYLDKYGMRCTGEIDITRTRWSEKPAILIPMILSHIKTFKPGESIRKFQQGQQDALRKEEEILAGLKLLPDGEQKANETRQKIGLIRNFSGYREYPKYALMSRYFVYKQALIKEVERFLRHKGLHDKEDLYFLTFQELREAIRTNELDHQIIAQRKEEYKRYEKLTPPRVITSDGEVIAGKYKRENLPAEAIIGLAVSSGIIEGRARVLVSMEDADIGEGDILVTPFTDPSWTPLFVSIKGLVTEVGGLMTHGAVIAREYGLPAVVGAENATKLIKDGQRIRVNGTEGYVEILRS
jgi:phosphoenolpyruvate synthase/pyruvate phosphate dikinase